MITFIFVTDIEQKRLPNGSLFTKYIFEKIKLPHWDLQKHAALIRDPS